MTSTITRRDFLNGWQAVCIAVLFALHPSYYGEELHKTIELIGRIASYIVLIAMTVTSFFQCVEKCALSIGAGCNGWASGTSGRRFG
jgi:hypothetical protein